MFFFVCVRDIRRFERETRRPLGEGLYAAFNFKAPSAGVRLLSLPQHLGVTLASVNSLRSEEKCGCRTPASTPPPAPGATGWLASAGNAVHGSHPIAQVTLDKKGKRLDLNSP